MSDSLEVTLLGCDGSTWNLTDPTSPVQLATGLGGLHLPKVSHRWSTTARRAGRSWKGSVADARAFTMNLLVGKDAGVYGADWRSLDATFWEALSTDETATLVVNGVRSLAFRLDEDNETDFADDPGNFGLATYKVDCIADRPEWLGKPVTATFTFQAQDTSNYYGGVTGLGPPFYISEASLFDTASVSNPGDLPTPAVWTITGPADAARFGVDGHVIQPPFALQSGDRVIVDTDAETIMDATGNSLWPLMGFTPVDFASIPPGDEVPIVVGMDNPGPGASISVSLTPRYRRGWGVEASSPLVVSGHGGSGGGLGDGPLGDAPLGD